MRVVLAIGSLEIGGSERQLVRLAVELRRLEHDVRVVVLMRGGPLEADLVAAGIPVVDLGIEGLVVRHPSGRIALGRTAMMWLRCARLLPLLLRLRPDVVHAYLFWAYVLLMPAAWLARVPVRLTGRRNLGTEKARNPVFPMLERLADWCSTGAVANSSAVADVVVATGFPAHRVVVVPNGVDIPDRRADPSTEPPRGVMIANLIAYKGHLDLVEAVGRLERRPVIDCYGDGPERSSIERAIRQHGLEDVVRLHGRRADAALELLGAQFAVLASHEEGLPNAVLEAMAAGVPVIATAVGGVPEILDDGVTGLVVPPRDPAALAAALHRLTEDRVLRAELGARARARIVESFSWRACVDAHLAIYSSRSFSRRAPLPSPASSS